MEPLSYERRGYLNEDFRLFHLADSSLPELEYHYHSFHKLVFLLAGKAGYAIEGQHYTLEPGDFVLVGSGSIHRPEIIPGTFYERIILYISPEYLTACASDGCDPGQCFRLAQSEFRYVYHAGAEILSILRQLETAEREQLFGAKLLCTALFLQLAVAVNRTVSAGSGVDAAVGDAKTVSILHYLNLHLREPLSIDELAARFYVSKYHMMRRFREETGYSIHSYLSEKRLLLARQLLQNGEPPSAVCECVGFQSYAAFARAYRGHFGVSPANDKR